MAETYTYDNSPDTEVLTEEEQDSLAVGEELMEQQENLLAGKYKNAQDLESAYIELQKKLGEGSSEEAEEVSEEPESDNDVDPVVDMLAAASEEYAQDGAMSQETFDALSEMSSEELLNAYVAMQSNAAPAQQAADLSDSDVQKQEGFTKASLNLLCHL